MKQLREKVSIKTPLGIIQGELYVGQGWLPEVEVSVFDSWGNDRRFTPSSFPDAWDMDVPLGQLELGPLLRAWLMIDTARGIVAEAQREDEGERDANSV